MNERQIRVLYHLLEEPVDSFGPMAERLDIHERTLYRDFKRIMDWLVERGIVSGKQAEQGHHLLWENREVWGDGIRRLLEKEDKKKKLDAQTRRMAILTELLLGDPPIKIFSLADRLKVSENTIINDLDRLEDWMKDHQVQIVRKQGLGVYLEGQENQIRKAIMEVILQESGTHRLRVFLTRRDEDKSKGDQGDPVDRLLSMTDQKTLLVVEESIRQMEQQRGGQFSDDAYIGLFAHLMIALTRIKRGDTITISREILDSLKTTVEFSIAQGASARLGERLGYPIPVEETAYITMHLRGAKVVGKRLAFEEALEEKYQVEQLARSMLQQAAMLSGIAFDEDEDLYQGLLIHLRPALTRLEHKLEIRNPLLEQIKNQYGDLFYLSREICRILAEALKTPVPEEEVAFVAMHLGAFVERRKTKELEKVYALVVCPSGLGTSRLLTSRIKQNIPEAVVVGTTSLEEAQEFLSMNPRVDLVISTVELGSQGFPYIVVSPLLTEEDTVRIRGRFQSQVAKRYHWEIATKETTGPPFDFIKVVELVEAWRVLDEGFFLKDGLAVTSSESWLDYITRFVHFGSPDLAKELRKELDQRENLMGTAMEEFSLALIHTRTKTLDQALVGVFRNRQPVPFRNMEGKSVPVDLVLFMVAGTNATKSHLEGLSKISASLMEDPGFIKLLRKGTLEELRDYLKELFGTLVQEYGQNRTKN